MPIFRAIVVCGAVISGLLAPSFMGIFHFMVRRNETGTGLECVRDGGDEQTSSLPAPVHSRSRGMDAFCETTPLFAFLAGKGVDQRQARD